MCLCLLLGKCCICSFLVMDLYMLCFGFSVVYGFCSMSCICEWNCVRLCFFDGRGVLLKWICDLGLVGCKFISVWVRVDLLDLDWLMSVMILFLCMERLILWIVCMGCLLEW